MPTETTVTRCGNCGATLDRRPGQSVLLCAYCEQTTYLAPTSAPTITATAAPPDEGDSSLHRRLMRGPSGNAHGAATRYAPSQVPNPDVTALERGVWPVNANASSTYGGSWSPSALLGPPRVFPRCGDIGGAWAPGPSRSEVEWVELEYRVDLPVAAVRVFETNRPGSTFAVVDVTRGEELLYEGPARVDGQAQMLEVAVSPARVIRRLRVYVVNPGWAEIDTVGLVAAAPLPVTLRTRAVAPAKGCGVLGFFSVAAVAVAIAGAVIAARDKGPRAGPPRPAVTVGGATLRYTTPVREFLPLRDIEWAHSVVGYSTQYSTGANAAGTALHEPDVYPAYGDLPQAWASRATDGGTEWIEVRFLQQVLATSVLWAETFNPGAVVRVDDLTDPAAPTVLWEGTAPAPTASSVMAEVTLPAPRWIRVVRIVLDTRRVAGWNEIDAIGLARTQ